mgnify:CR=1 FL=1
MAWAPYQNFDIRMPLGAHAVAPYSVVPLAMAIAAGAVDGSGTPVLAGRFRRYFPGNYTGAVCGFINEPDFGNQIGQWVEKEGILRPGLFVRAPRCNQSGCDGCQGNEGLLHDVAHVIETIQQPENHRPEHCAIPEQYGGFLLGLFGESGQLPSGIVDAAYRTMAAADDAHCWVVIEGAPGDITQINSVPAGYMQIGFDEIASPTLRLYHHDSYCRFRLDIPSGSTILDARLVLTMWFQQISDVKVNVKLLDRDSMNPFSATVDHPDNPIISNPNGAGRVTGIGPFEFVLPAHSPPHGDGYRIVLDRLAALVQAFIDRPGYDPVDGGYMGIELESDRAFNIVDFPAIGIIQRIGVYEYAGISYPSFLIRPALFVRYAEPGVAVEYDEDGAPIMPKIDIEVTPQIVVNTNTRVFCASPGDFTVNPDWDVFSASDDPAAAGSFKYFVLTPVPPIESWWSQETHGDPPYDDTADDQFPLNDCETYGIPAAAVDPLGEPITTIASGPWHIEPGLRAIVGVSEQPARAGIVKAYIGGNGDSLPMVENVWRVYHGRSRATRHKYPGSLADAIHTGTSQGGGPNTIVLDAAASMEDGYYDDMLVRTTGGTGANQWSKIVDYDGATRTATIEGTWAVTPDATTTFTVIPDKGWYVEYTGYVKAWFAVDSHWLQIASGRPWCFQDGAPGDPYQCIYHWNCWYQGRIDAKWRGDTDDPEFAAWIAAHDAGFGATFEPGTAHCHDPLAGLCLPEDSPPDGKAMGDQLWPPAANQDGDSFGAPPGIVETPPCRTLHGEYSWAYLPELGSNHPTTPIAGPVVPQLPESGLWHETRTAKKTTPDGATTETVYGWADLRFVSNLPTLSGA